MLSCDLHDYIEIACLYRIEVELTLRDGRSICGTAMDTGRNAEKQECIVMTDEDKQRTYVVLEELRSMRALVKNPHFDVVEF